MILTLLAVTIPGFALGLLLTAIANGRARREERRRRWLKMATYLVVVHVVLLLTVLGRPWILVGAALILIVGFRELDRALRYGSALRWPVLSAYVALGLALLYSVNRSAPMTVAFLYLVVAVFDGFSQAVGQAAGRRKLAATLSPGKTIEGALGGAAVALVVAVLARDLAGLDKVTAASLGLAIALCALAGDLSASWIKRRVGIKDFSTLIPGHGGVLDRFDGFIGAGALVGPALAAMATKI